MKHPIKMSQTKQESDLSLSSLECSTCEDKFTSLHFEDLQTHKQEHLNEIENLDIEYLKKLL